MITTNQTRPSPRPVSPPPSSSSSVSITRSASTQKRVSNGEISSTTAISVNRHSLVFHANKFFFRNRNQYYKIHQKLFHREHRQNDHYHRLVLYQQKLKHRKSVKVRLQIRRKKFLQNHDQQPVMTRPMTKKIKMNRQMMTTIMSTMT